MGIEQERREEAKDCQNQRTIKYFHRELRDFYHLVRRSCVDFPRDECEETPKLVCLRCLRKYPPVQCALYDAGYFPLTVDKKFVKDVAIMEIDDLKPAKKVTKKHGRRFMRMLRDIKTFRLTRTRQRPPKDPLETMAGVNIQD